MQHYWFAVIIINCNLKYTLNILIVILFNYYCTFDQINEVLVRGFQKHKKTTPNVCLVVYISSGV